VPNCPQCGTALGVGDLAGLCPTCLVQGAFASSGSTLDSDTEGVANTRAIESGSDAHAHVGGPAEDGDFGRYHIVRPLGEGGMGTVYLAEQRDPIRREVIVVTENPQLIALVDVAGSAG
jgi:hypothetical protein